MAIVHCVLQNRAAASKVSFSVPSTSEQIVEDPSVSLFEGQMHSSTSVVILYDA